jgi:ligand-binding sensor domain-containing protein
LVIAHYYFQRRVHYAEKITTYTCYRVVNHRFAIDTVGVQDRDGRRRAGGDGYAASGGSDARQIPHPSYRSGNRTERAAGKSPQLNPPYQPTAAQGVACIGTFGYGVTCIENQEWHTYTEAEENLGGDLVHAMTTCPDGSVLAAHTMGLSRYNDREWREYENGWGYGSVEALACGRYSHFWVAHFGGVSHFDGVKWQTYPAVEHLLGAPGDPELLDDIAITAEGDVWAATANSVAWFTNNEWRVFAEGTGFDIRYFLANIALDAQGRPWVSSSRGL